MSEISTMRPARMMPTRSQRRWTSPKKWEEKKTVTPFLFSSRINSKNFRCIKGSSPLVGSSRKSNFGLCSSPCTMPTFSCCRKRGRGSCASYPAPSPQPDTQCAFCGHQDKNWLNSSAGQPRANGRNRRPLRASNQYPCEYQDHVW